MDVDAWYTSVSEEFKTMFSAVAARLQPGALRPFISTMTYTAQLTGDLPPSKVLLQHMRETKSSYFTSVEESAFCANVIHLGSIPGTTKVKLFNKGAVQLTGCTSHIECLNALGEIQKFICDATQIHTSIASINLCLINFNAMILPINSNQKIHLEHLACVARGHPYNVLAERPDRPASCILHARNGKIMVYATGKCSVHAKSPSDVDAAFSLLTEIVKAHAGSIIIQATSGSQAPKASWYDVLAVGMPGLIHTHPPSTVLIHGCPYCTTFGNVFAT